MNSQRNFRTQRVFIQFFENYPVEKQTFRIFLRLRRHDFLIGSLYDLESLQDLPS